MIQFTVPGKPHPKERPRLGRNGNTYTPRATVDAERRVGWAYRAAHGRKIPKGQHVRVTMIFHCAPNQFPKVDVDNLTKVVLDGLNGVAYHDDSQVVEALARKQPSTSPHTIVEITTI